LAFLTKPPPPAGIYVHVPFCARKCLYCDFYSITDLSLRDDFLEALYREISATKSLLPFDSLYIGGGTPSILSAHQISRIIDRISGQFTLDISAEITLEVNPGTVTRQSLKAYRQMGVTRLNIGVQSFQDSHLQWLGRMHSADAAKDAILWARAAGFDQIGMDLIYGLPGQSRKAWLADLHQAISFDPEHLSCYMLTCEPETPLDRMRRHQEFEAMADGDVCDLFETTVTELSKQGYPLYEISNFARKDNAPHANRSRHNQKYWTDVPYLGFGPAAHSYLNPVRYRNHRDIAAYMADINSGTLPIAEKETLSMEQLLMETVFLGFRTVEGISIQQFEEKSGRPFRILFQDLLTDPELKRLITLTPEHCSLTFQGMMVLDAIAGMFVERI
jgi:oxygen-independent coproporphyrinogen III oxidase